MEFVPDIEKARRIAAVVNGFSNSKPDDLGGLVAETLAREAPDLQTLAAACTMVKPMTANFGWHEQMRLALTAPLQAAMVESQVAAQAALSVAADRLARRNYWVATASLIAAGLSLLVSLAQALHVV